MTAAKLTKLTREMRREIIEISHRNHGSHVGSSFSIIDILAALYFNVMRVYPSRPWHSNRDRFVLSKGHAALALYAVLAHRGFFSAKRLQTFLKDGSLLVGHPESRTLPGVEATTGSLGHGLSVAAGMALAAKRSGRRNRVFVLLSDGECDEGEVWEAALFAAHHKLDNLTVIVDYNKLQAFGTTNTVLELEPFVSKWESFGWSVREHSGHNFAALTKTFSLVPFTKGKPSALIAQTTMGKGVSFMEDQLAWHYLEPTKEHLDRAQKELQ